MAQVVECLPNKLKVVSSNLSTERKKKRKKERKLPPTQN
jgi:hypothetical protein